MAAMDVNTSQKKKMSSLLLLLLLLLFLLLLCRCFVYQGRYSDMNIARSFTNDWCPNGFVMQSDSISVVFTLTRRMLPFRIWSYCHNHRRWMCLLRDCCEIHGSPESAIINIWFETSSRFACYVCAVTFNVSSCHISTQYVWSLTGRLHTIAQTMGWGDSSKQDRHCIEDKCYLPKVEEYTAPFNGLELYVHIYGELVIFARRYIFCTTCVSYGFVLIRMHVYTFVVWYCEIKDVTCGDRIYWSSAKRYRCSFFTFLWTNVCGGF